MRLIRRVTLLMLDLTAVTLLRLEQWRRQSPGGGVPGARPRPRLLSRGPRARRCSTTRRRHVGTDSRWPSPGAGLPSAGRRSGSPSPSGWAAPITGSPSAMANTASPSPGWTTVARPGHDLDSIGSMVYGPDGAAVPGACRRIAEGASILPALEYEGGAHQGPGLRFFP